jgi:hypothetical protein
MARRAVVAAHVGRSKGRPAGLVPGLAGFWPTTIERNTKPFFISKSFTICKEDNGELRRGFLNLLPASNCYELRRIYAHEEELLAARVWSL